MPIFLPPSFLLVSSVSLEYSNPVCLPGCSLITSSGLAHLSALQPTLTELDLSGCFRLLGPQLAEFSAACPDLEPASLSYCNDIEDGPWQDQGRRVAEPGFADVGTCVGQPHKILANFLGSEKIQTFRIRTF